MELPGQIHDIRRWSPKPGDRLILKNAEIEIDGMQATQIARLVRRALQLPEDFPVAVIGRDWEFEVMEGPE